MIPRMTRLIAVAACLSLLLVAPASFAQTVRPGMLTEVTISNSDLNDVICPGAISDVLTSEEKGVQIKASGQHAFVKLTVTEQYGERQYATDPVDLVIVCDDQVYKLLAQPDRIPMQTIQLVAPAQRVDANVQAMAGMPLERRILGLLAAAYRDQVPDAWTVGPPPKAPSSFPRGVSVTPRRSISIDGQGLLLEEFVLRARGGVDAEGVTLDDTVLLPLLTRATPLLALSVDPPQLSSGESGRLFVIYRRLEAAP